MRFDAANTAFNPSETSLSPSNVASLAEDWRAGSTPGASPVVAGSVVYTGCQNVSICSYDATNGALRWKADVGFREPPRWSVLVGDVLHLGSAATEYALDASSGAVLWKTLVSNAGGDFTTPPVVSDGLVIQGTTGFVFAWDATTGVQRWVVRLDVRGAPAVVNGVVYVQDTAGPTLYALRVTTGETLWRSQPAVGFPGRAPIVANGLVITGATRYSTDTTGVLSAYPAAGCGAAVCSPVWSHDGGRTHTGDAAAANGILYQGFADGTYAAIEVATGRLLWKTATDGSGVSTPAGTGPPTVANGLLFGNGGDTRFYAWPAAGCGAPVCPALWSTSAGSGFTSRSDVAVVGGRLYMVDDLSQVHAYSPRVNPPPALIPPPPPDAVPPVPTPPATINVPADQPSIQRAIDASGPGGVVVVAPGVYHERLNFHGREVEVRSSGGPDVTTIDGDSVSTTIAMGSREPRATVLRGFTLRNGAGSGVGGAIIIEGSPTITGNVFSGNVGSSGGAVEVRSGAPLIVDNEFRDNHTENSGGWGGAVNINGSPGTEVRGNLIQDNSAGLGGGIRYSGDGPVTIADNVIRRNSAASGGGIYVSGNGDIRLLQNLIVENIANEAGGGVTFQVGGAAADGNTIAANTATRGSGIWSENALPLPTFVRNVITGPRGHSVVECYYNGYPVPSFSSNDIYSGDASPTAGCGAVGAGFDPRFVDPGAGDYRLSLGSPAIDAGDAAAAPVPATDLAGNARVVDGNGDGTARVDLGAYEARLPVPELAAGDEFHPLAPARILDTRAGNGAPLARLGPGSTLDLQVTGRGGVPATGVTAVVLNVTVTEPTATSFLTVWPAGATMPLASNLNYTAGLTVPNLVVVKVGTGGQVRLYNYSGTTHVIADVAGWYGSDDTLAGGARFTPLAPSRLLDTRFGTGAPTAPVGPASSLALQVTGRGGVPATGVSAVVLNVTVTEPTQTSFITAWPTGQPRPLASNLNDAPGQTVPNLVVVKVGDGGMVSLYNNAGWVHLVADVAGWYGEAPEVGAGFTSVVPARVLDTRNTIGAKAGPGSVIDLNVTGRGGVPAYGVSAVVLNVTVTEATATSFLTAWPSGAARPLASNLNYIDGSTVPNLVTVKVGEGGRVSLYNHAGWTHVIADVAGWYSG